MNVDILNIGHYRATSHGGRQHVLFNRKTDKVYPITSGEFASIKKMGNVMTCEAVEQNVSDGNV